MRALLDRLNEPVDAAGLAAFRILFGAAMCFGALRFLWNGWVERFFGQPTYYFAYWGFDWLPIPAESGLVAIFWSMAVLAALITVGLWTRAALVAFFVLFTYVELLDVTNYLNHYVLVSMVTALLAFLPVNARWSIDAWRRPDVRRDLVPRFAYDWLRFQVGAVWISAAIAKMTPDWLLGAQPLNIWLNARVDTPIIGSFLDVWEVALAASWAGMFYDLTIVFLLAWRPTRRVAFAAVVVFHFMTSIWFNIGMFPVIMVVCATIFFEPSWPSDFRFPMSDVRFPISDFRFRSPISECAPTRLSSTTLVIAAVWCAVLVVLPVRFIAYGGDVLWHEQGMRWGFKVMCREKNGSVTYRVRLPSEEREVLRAPHEWLTPDQEREMSGQPDMILRLSHDIRDEYRARGHHDVEIYVDAIASLNGRPPAPLVDPNVDLAGVEDGLGAATWILPGPSVAPPRLGRQLFAPPDRLVER